MIIPRHRICDICLEEVGCNKRYFIIKSKDRIYGDVLYSDNRKHDICEDCMDRLKAKIREEMVNESEA